MRTFILFYFIFENNIFVNFICTTSENNLFTLFGVEKFCISFSPENKWFQNTTADENMTEAEEILSIHSYNCSQRWEKIVPENFEKKCYCRNCFYFLPISGQFYFFDYGLCSNSRSTFDGKVVEIKSNCDFFSEHFEICK